MLQLKSRPNYSMNVSFWTTTKAKMLLQQTREALFSALPIAENAFGYVVTYTAEKV